MASLHQQDDSPQPNNENTTEMMSARPFSSSSSSSSGSDTDHEQSHGLQRSVSRAVMEDDDIEQLRRVATAVSQSRRRSGAAFSTADSTNNIPPDGPLDPKLDPASKAFDLEAWLHYFIDETRRQGGLGVQEQGVGLTFQDLSVSGTGAALQLQDTVGSVLAAPLRLNELLSFRRPPARTILHRFDGHVAAGELLVVLGRPGSGCSTLLKTVTGQLHGLRVGEASTIHYSGIPQQQMMKEFRGEALYNQEVDKHFPQLTVGQTLEFAAASRTPQQRVWDLSRDEFGKQAARVAMAICGLTHTYNTKVGDDFIRGVSGGERKRVSIAEMMLAGSPIAAWDNSTRGLDSATALKFVQSLRLAADFTNSVHAVAIYQASQAIYDLFDKATVLYDGRQIYFGPAAEAKAYFEEMGWYCPPRQTTGDFLTSVTNPQERVARPGMEDQVPRTPEEFEVYWHQSAAYRAIRDDMGRHEEAHPISAHGTTAQQMRAHKQTRQAKHARPASPYLISPAMQVQLTTRRAYQRLRNDMAATVAQLGMNVVLALIIGSVFYNIPDASAGFFSRASVIFQAILMNALTALSEINTLYAQRPIVEKHAAYAFYHPCTEAMAGILSDIPLKFLNAVVFQLIVYFMAGLRREAGPFFLFFLIIFTSTFVMSAIFRTMAAITKTVSQAMTLAGVMVLALVIYTGFVLTVPTMHPWFSWIRWLNPLYYAFEILLANEFHGRSFTCSSIIPSYSPPQGDSWICSVASAVAGERTVSGDRFINVNYGYYHAHTWRNFGILIAFLVAFMTAYFVASELNAKTTSEAEVLVFPRGNVPQHLLTGDKVVTEDVASAAAAAATKTASAAPAMAPQTDVFTWRDVVYDVNIKGETRRLLDHVCGWVKPGTLTALMGVSGAGKTTLLDALAQRTTMGVLTGDMLVNGRPIDASFQRKTGYVQQQDLHLSTATVRESLRFSALLRQPASVSRADKYRYVEEVIDMLGMRDFAHAVVGVPGQGLNVEQRKLLTIGVELAAKPKLLLFLDEPTSGLDSQSAWAICAFLRKLADHGQAILCTIHQPSAVLFQQFDRLLFLARGGRTVYFGDIGKNSRMLLDYFESHGASEPCGDDENPAEYMLNVVNAGANARGEDWPAVWNASEERQAVLAEMDRLHAEGMAESTTVQADTHDEFAMPLSAQLATVTHRVFQQYWRRPDYILAKLMLGVVAGLFIGFSFYGADGSQAGMQNVLFAVFMLVTIFTSLVQQIQPHFVTQRDLYEVRERPSKAYSWKAFMVANVVVELPYQVLTGILIYVCFYYPVTGVQSSAQQGLVLLFSIQFMLYASSFAQMTIACMPDPQTAASIVTLLVLFSLTFCGIMQAPAALPGFWIFMYRASPFTYWIAGIVSTQLHDRPVTCSTAEMSIFDPPTGQTCGTYLADYLQTAPGRLHNPDATAACEYCSLKVADQFLEASEIYYSERWRNFGIMWVYIVFNISVAVVTYWAFRVKRWRKE